MSRDIKSKEILARYAAGERIFRDLDRGDGIYDFSHSESSWRHFYWKSPFCQL